MCIRDSCKATGTLCGGVDLYLAVGESEISVSWCPCGYSGYWYGVCFEGELGDVEMDDCVYKAPTKVSYPRSIYQFVVDVSGRTDEWR